MRSGLGRPVATGAVVARLGLLPLLNPLLELVLILAVLPAGGPARPTAGQADDAGASQQCSNGKTPAA